MLEGLDQVAWRTLQQPPDNNHDSVARALGALSAARTQGEAQTAYNRVLYAVGNNHAGTYWPVVLATIPFLEELVSHPSAIVRESTLDILIDLVGSFAPERGYEKVTIDGEARSLSEALRTAVGQIRFAPASSIDVLGHRERALRQELAEYTAEVGGEE